MALSDEYPEATVHAGRDGRDVAVSVHRTPDDRRLTLWTELVGSRRVVTRLEIDSWPVDWSQAKWLKIMTQRVLRDPLPDVVGDGLTAVGLRSTPLGSYVQGQAQALAVMASGTQEPGWEAARPGEPPVHLPRTAELGRQMRYFPDALHYALAVRRGDKTPAVTLAKVTGRPLATVRTRIAAARKLGLLTSERAGSAGGRLTPQGVDLLRFSLALGNMDATPDMQKLLDDETELTELADKD